MDVHNAAYLTTKYLEPVQLQKITNSVSKQIWGEKTQNKKRNDVNDTQKLCFIWFNCLILLSVKAFYRNYTKIIYSELYLRVVKTLLTLEHICSKSEYFNLRFHLQKLFFLIFIQFTHTFI